MVRGHKTPGMIATELKMRRLLHNGSFLILEGVDDLRFWRRRKHVECELVDGEGKPNVVGGIDRLDSVGFQGAIGVVDDDYDSLLGKRLSSPNLVTTAVHDLECLLCRSTALDKVLDEYGDIHKLQRFEKRNRQDARSALLDRSAAIGRVRWAALRLGIGIDSKTWRVPRFVAEGDWSVDDKTMLAVAAPNHVDKLRREIDALPTVDLWRIARGHDMIEILRIGLKKVLGNISPTVGVKEISRSLRLAMPPDELKSTGLGQAIRDWESHNKPYSVFPHENTTP